MRVKSNVVGGRAGFRAGMAEVLGSSIARTAGFLPRRLDIMAKWILSALLTAVLVAGLPQVAGAQYMYMDANGNGIHDNGDRLNVNNDSTFVDIYLVTDLNRNGSAVTCNTDPLKPM